MTRKQKRLAIIGGLGAVLALAVALILFALRDQIVFFYSPTEIQTKAVAVDEPVRLGGLVKEGSWTRDGQSNDFIITDGANEIGTHYQGILPDLFKEGQGVVVEGAMTASGGFLASNVLAKHDENYMPKEVVDALKEAGEWQRGEAGG